MVDIRYIRTSTLLIEMEGLTILTDPWFRMHLRGLPCLMRPGIALADLPRIDVVLVSHYHPDHFDRRAISTVAHPSMVIVGPPGLVERRRELPSCRLEELKAWDSLDLGGLRITATPAVHTGPGPDEENYLLESEESPSVFFGGDCAFSAVFEAIGASRSVDVALLPVGGTRIFGRKTVMDPGDALRAAKRLGADWLIPIHEGGAWLSVPPLSLHPGRPETLLALAKGSTVEARVLRPGEGVRFVMEDGATRAVRLL